MSPAGLHNGVVDALVKASPQVLFLLFGRRSILSSATMWQSILYPPLFSKVIDYGLTFLFNWKTQNISTSQKLAAYPHLYSFTSTKSVVHWFQIIRTKSFQMFDDDVHPPMLLSSSSKYTKVAKYPTRNIKTPVVLVYGGSDSLVDIKVMLRELPNQTVATEIPHYEHLDFLWARDVDTQVFQHVFDALESFTGAEHTKEEYERYQSARHSSLSASSFFRRHTQRGSDAALDSDVSTAVGNADDDPAGPTVEHREYISPETDYLPHLTSSPHRSLNRLRQSHIPFPNSQPGFAKPRAPQVSTTVDEDEFAYASPTSPQSVRFLEDGGGAGVDGSAEPADQASPSPRPPKRRGTGGSHVSLDSMKGGRGISLGASKAVGGVITGATSGVDFGNMMGPEDSEMRR